MWAAVPEYEKMITEHLFSHFKLNHVKEGEFRFCGREYKQADDYGITVTCKNNIEKILPIKYDRAKRSMEDKANEIK